MSRLIHKLEEIARGGDQPLGFGATLTQAKSPSLVVIASVSSKSPAKVWPREGADAFLVSGLSPGQELPKALVEATGNLPWGLELESGSPGDMAALREKGADFVIFPVGTSFWVLAEDEPGKVLRVSLELSDSHLAAIDALPIDGVLVAQREALKVEHLLALQRILNLVSKPLLVEATSSSPEELKQICSLGIEGLVLPGEEKRLLEIRKVLEGQPSKKRKERGVRPLLPRLHPSLLAKPSEEEDEEEDT